MARRRHKNEVQASLEERLGPDVLKRLEAMAQEFVRFEKGQFGFYIDPARYAVKDRQVGPLGRGRRRKVVAGVDKDGNVVTAWIGVDSKTQQPTKTEAGETVNIPEAYAAGAGYGGGGGGGAGGVGGSGGGGAGGGAGPGAGSGSGSGVGASGTGPGTGSGTGPGSAPKNGESSAAAIARAATARRNPLAPKATPPGPAAPKAPLGAVAQKDNTARGRKKKPLHWAKVPKNLVNTSVWATLKDDRILLDEAEIDELFGVDSAPVFEVTAEEVKPEVLPHKRKHNINILLANLKMSSDEIKDVIRATTYKQMEAGTLQGLLLICPTPEEEELLRANENLRDQVDLTDNFMMQLAELPGLRGKMMCALAALTFHDEAADVIQNMDTFSEIPVEVMKSTKLTTVLEGILALGNFLNSGTPRGGAHGFKLEALAMLSTVKDTQGDTSLDYLVRVLDKHFPGTIPLDDMPSLPRSSEISLDAIGEEVQSLLDSINNVGAQVKSIAASADASLAVFLAEMEAFSNDAVKVREEIIELRACMMKNLQEMMAYFGERNKMARGRQEDVLRMLREFAEDAAAAQMRKAEKKAREERAAQKAGNAPSSSQPQLPNDSVHVEKVDHVDISQLPDE